MEMLLSVVLLLSLPSDGLSGPLCPTVSSSAGTGHGRRLMFLQRSPLGHVVLYLSDWTEDNRLIRCSHHSNPLITEEYLSLCEKTTLDVQTEAAIRRLNISMLLSAESDSCTQGVARETLSVGLTTQRGDGRDPAWRTSEASSRTKRSWFPGTLWCGVGSSAMEYNQLGMFENADVCCREHDHCVHIIPPFTVNYGTFNTKPFTVSHCDCDHRFRQCLVGMNDTISNMVGYSFFNLFSVPCFNLIQKIQCTEMTWWGWCKVSKEAPYAVFQYPLGYNTSAVTSKPAAVSMEDNNSTCIENCALTIPNSDPDGKQGPEPTPPGCSPTEPPRGDTFQPRRTGKSCLKTTTSPSPLPTLQTTLLAHPTPANPFLKMARAKAQLKTTRVASGVVESGGKATTAGLWATYASLASSEAITWKKPNASSVSQKTVLNVLNAATRTAVSPRRHKNVRMKQGRCLARMPINGSHKHPWRKACSEEFAMAHGTATMIPSTVGSGLPRQRKTVEKQRPNRIAAGAAGLEGTTSPVRSVIISGMEMSGIQTASADTLRDNGSAPRNANETLGNTTASLPGAVESNLAHCTVLLILDECKYRIPALSKKYGLKNMEAKTIYHCDCINRLTFQMELIKQTRAILSLLLDFVSKRCFDVPLQNCLNRKRCIGYFSEAPAAFQALDRVENEEKINAAKKNVLQYSKIVIPVRFYRRCLLRTVAPGMRQ